MDGSLGDGRGPSPDPGSGDRGFSPDQSPDPTSIAPAPEAAAPPPARPRWGASWKLRAALAVLGGAAAVGAVVTAVAAVSGRMASREPAAVAKAASVARAVAGAMLAAEDEAGAGDAGDAETDAAPPHGRPATWRVARLADDPSVTLTEGTMGKHPLLAVLSAAGLSHAEAHRVVASLSEVRDVDRFDPKDTYALARDKASGRVVAYELASSPVDVWQAREQALDDGGMLLVARQLELTSERVRVRKAVLVGADLRASLGEAGLAPVDDVLAMLDDALEGHAEVADIRPGARLRIIATQELVEGAFVRWASLDAVEYLPASQSQSASPVRVYWFGDDEHRHGWYDARGRQPVRGGWRLPLLFARVVSRFNPHRMHPVLHVVMPHNGVDFAAPVGTPVYATAAGVVSSVGNGGPCGNEVAIDHAGGMTSVYCHLSRFAPGLHPGQRVESRQLIAYSGQTGRVTGPHLHFGMKHDGAFIDPMSLRLDGVRVVPRSRRDEFDRLRAGLDEELDGIPLPAPPAGEPPAAESKPGEGESFDEGN